MTNDTKPEGGACWNINITCPRCQYTADVEVNIPCDSCAAAYERGRADMREEAMHAAESAHAAFLDSRWPDMGDRPSSPPAALEPHWWAIDRAIRSLSTKAVKS